MDRSLNQKTYERLKKDILTFELKPGEVVSAAKLAERYEVSRTPAREALVKMEAQGLVNIIPQSGTRISKISINRARQEWFVRKTLELGMVDPFFEKMRDSDLELMEMYNGEMRKTLEQTSTPDNEYERLGFDNDFHGVTYMVANQKLSANIIYLITAHYNRIRMLIDREQENKQRTLDEHILLMECARMRDKERYREVLSGHLTHLFDDIERMKEKYPEYFED